MRGMGEMGNMGGMGEMEGMGDWRDGMGFERDSEKRET
jgi:hypothetical protein